MSEIKGTTNFEKLFSRKLNKILKKKGNFDYLSWAHAWEIMKKNDPQATVLLMSINTTGLFLELIKTFLLRNINLFLWMKLGLMYLSQ